MSHAAIAADDPQISTSVRQAPPLSSSPSTPETPPRQIAAEQPDSSPQPGTKTRTIRAFAFAGGGFDTVNQLGVIHALIVGQCRPPDLVVGISGGAVNAVTLAEVLQAGEDNDGNPNPSAQVARFREIFEAVRSFPAEYLQELLPDPFEVDARAPLKPQSLPLNSPEERKERLEALNARFGLIRLFNDILAIDLPVSRFTRIIRRILEWKQLAEEKWIKCWSLRLWHAFMLWCALGFNIPRIARPLTHLYLGVKWSSRYRHMLERISFAKSFREDWSGWIVTWLWKKWLVLLGFPAPATALDIIRRRTSGRYVQRILRDPINVGFVSLVWLAAGAPFVILTVFVVFWVTSRLGTWPGLSMWPSVTLFVSLVAWFGVALVLYQRPPTSAFSRKLLASYNLATDLGTPYALKRFLVRLFDPTYYGKVDLGEVVDGVFGNKAGPANETTADQPKRTLGDYAPPSKNRSRIHVYPLVADLKTRKIVPVAPSASVVDALLAACANAPMLRPQRIPMLSDEKLPGEGQLEGQGKLSHGIDALNVTNDPLFGIFTVLAKLYKKRDRAIVADGEDPVNHQIEIYPVTSLPPKPDLRRHDPTQKPERVQTCEEILDAMLLQQFQDADVGKSMVEAVNAALPPQQAFYEVSRGDQAPFVYVKANVQRIQPEQFDHLNRKVLLASSDDERRDAIAEGVAKGCRAALKVLLETTIVKNQHLSADGLSCADIMKLRRGECANLSGSDRTHGPGIPEVCIKCRSIENNRFSGSSAPNKEREDWPMWNGHESEGTMLKRSAVRVETSRLPPTQTQAPAIAALFSGGVFRGVFQVGVIAALEQFGVKPQVIGGASVGSIMSAMAAEIAGTKDSHLKKRFIADLAATFLCIDRLVLTDRFSDFVREFTLRAAGANFSLADLDQFFRRFDEPAAKEYSEGARRVLAGLERLFYVNPFEIVELGRNIRSSERRSDAVKQVEHILQYFLDESGIGQEALGAEPLQLLLNHHVLDHHPVDRAAFDLFRNGSGHPLRGINLLATATNLTTGRLAILGDETPADKTNLREGLLASSAFPGVFRPRWTWEVCRDSERFDQLIDGGVMDNLPIKAVVDFLERARNRPENPLGRTGTNNVPHLLFTASLEPEIPDLSDREVEEVAGFWRWTSIRARQLKYNKKVADYARVMQDIRQIVDYRRKQGEVLDHNNLPLDVEVVCVVPKWLCGTFAFHPMLGFRRENQARSIAHGCAMTHAKLHLVAELHKDKGWAKGWNLNDPVDDKCVKARPGHADEVEEIRPKQDCSTAGGCWICNETRCPFSKEAVRESYRATNAKLTEERVQQISAIHQYCRDSKTHQAPKPEWSH